MRDLSTETNSLPENHLAVAIYPSLSDVDAAIRELLYLGFDRQKLTRIERWSGKVCDQWGHQCVGLYNLQIPEESVKRYETALTIDKSILIAQWTTDEVPGGCEEINRTHPESVDEHQFSSSVATPDLPI